MKYCPVSGHPIDILALGKNAIQIRCPAGKWGFKGLFQSFQAAQEALNLFNPAVELPQGEQESRGGKIRVVGKLWATDCFTPAELTHFLTELHSPVPAPTVEPASTPQQITTKVKRKPRAVPKESN